MRTKLATTALLASLTLAGVALAPAAGAAPAPAVDRHAAAQTAPAAAPRFYAGGIWRLYQSNGPVVTMNLFQDVAGTLRGSATCCGIVGTVRSGRIDGRSIFFTIRWSNGSLGRYTGTLGPDRRLSGYSFDVRHPGSQATWHTGRTF